MDKTILKILLSWNGSLTSREFRVGLCLLFFLYSIISAFSSYDSYLFESAGGSSHSATYSIIVLKSFIPNLFYLLSLILLYSSFVVVMKRMRNYTPNLYATLLAGFVGFAFFSSLFAMQQINIFIKGRYGFDDQALISSLTTLGCVMLGLLLIGLVTFIVLAIYKKKDESEEPLVNFGVQKYALSLGNLAAVYAGICLLIYSLSAVVSNDFLHPGFDSLFIRIVFAILAVILLITLTVFALARLKDAGQSFWWVVGFWGVLFVAITFAILRLVFRWNGVTIYFIFQFYLYICIAALCVLFLLPTKQVR